MPGRAMHADLRVPQIRPDRISGRPGSQPASHQAGRRPSQHRHRVQAQAPTIERRESLKSDAELFSEEVGAADPVDAPEEALPSSQGSPLQDKCSALQQQVRLCSTRAAALAELAAASTVPGQRAAGA